MPDENQTSRRVQGVIKERPNDAHPGECIGGFDKPTPEQRLKQLQLRAADKELDLDAIGSGPSFDEDTP